MGTRIATKGDLVPEPTDGSFEAFLAHRPDVGEAYVNGDAGPLSAISTDRDPATFFGPRGDVVSGSETVLQTNQEGATNFAPGGRSTFEVLHAAADGDLGYLVGIQRATVRMVDTDDPIEMALRLTELYRREDGAWRLVHRHADALKDE